MKPKSVVFLAIYGVSSLSLISCLTNITRIPAETSFYAIDFTKYSAEGFLITPEKIVEDYESIGIVKYVIVPGAKYGIVRYIQYRDGTAEKEERWTVEKVTMSQGIDSLYSLAKSMGANAIMNFSATTTQRNYQNITHPITLDGYEFSGFAIRRKE